MTHVKLLHQLLHFCTSYCISVFTLKLRVVDEKTLLHRPLNQNMKLYSNKTLWTRQKGVSREQRTPSFPKNKHFLPPWYAHVRHLNFRSRACFEQRVPWHSGNYKVWIHSETRTWHDTQYSQTQVCSRKSNTGLY